MKQASIVLALIVGGVVGFFVRGAVDARPPAARPAPVAQGPRPPRPVEDPRAIYRVPVDDSPVKGPADALVTIVESSDFECPFCKRAEPTVTQIEQAYAGKVRLVWKHNPLPFHPDAMPAAEAAEEARAEGGDAKFWAMHDELFRRAPALDAASIAAAAKAVGVDPQKVADAIATRKYEVRIRRDQTLVNALGATGTPTFFVNGRKVVGALPFEAFKPIVDEELAKAQAAVQAGTPASQVYAKIVASGASSTVFLPGAPAPAAPGAAGAQPPPPPPAAVYRKVDYRPDDPVRGPKAAKVTIVLFSDFQCPFCGRVEPTLKQLQEEHPDDVRIVWKNQPLAMHPNAMPAALAAEAAREQGKFWPMHDKLFSNQAALSDATYAQYARELGLDLARFKAAEASKAAAARIADDQKLAAQVGANGTPTMFFNCRQVVGALPVERMRPILEEELKKADAILHGAKPDAGFYDRACAANLASAPPAPALAAAPPPGAPVDVTIRPDDPAIGSARAPVTLVVFSDFQCPFCGRLEPTLKQVEQAYGSKVRIVWKNQPLPMHPNAMPAALAAEAAREQGKFWPMHDRLFENQQQLSEAYYEQVARELGLDVAKWKAASAGAKARARVEEDVKQAAALGINGTPTMIVNGEKVVGAVPFEQLKSVIDAKLVARK